ncbi:uncharacterized protein N7483_000756 [Penicillium malachiteum]|uniref:uncharacterized protein n=1 Tax=Penicillium malachiteum TaxID=1324776 RepID=UPI0025493906|nr:uncharacterized protein N7483_000756 [Penicillium malachiteum]KAJ5735631.1 hypothetical protein N7483_000756 [Penicillium malachiteum]
MTSSAPIFQPLHFIPVRQQSEILDKKVQWMYAVAHEKLAQGGNHWCFYFQIGTNNSVNLDITPSYMVPSTSIPGGSKANMVLSDLTYVLSPATEKSVRLDVASEKTVRDFVDLLLQHSRHKYEFNDQGQGCRYWCYHQLDLLCQSGLLVNLAQIEEAKAAILLQWPSQQQYPLVQGGFYE